MLAIQYIPFQANNLMPMKQLSQQLRFSGVASLLSALLLLALPGTLQAQFTFTTNNAAITITGYTGSGGTVTIPSTTNGFPVTSIGAGAFENCGNLTNVTIPNSVTNIGYVAFFGCTNLTSVTIPNSVTDIGVGAFILCYSLTNVTIPNSVTSIGNEAFGACLNLTAITVDTNNANYNSLNGVLFDKSQTTLVEYPAGGAGSYTIPNSVTNIGTDAFYGCDALTKVTIGNSVTSIGSAAFYNCISLTGVYFTGNSPTPTNDLYVFQFQQTNTTVYYLPGTTGWGSTFDRLPTALWLPQMQTSGANFGVQSNQFGFSINWASDRVVVVEACTNLANPNWWPVATNTLTSGTNCFSDLRWTNYPSRFYRIRSP